MKKLLTLTLTIMSLSFSLSANAQMSSRISGNMFGGDPGVQSMVLGFGAVTASGIVGSYAPGIWLLPVSMGGIMVALSGASIADGGYNYNKEMVEEVAQELAFAQEELLQTNEVNIQNYALISSLLEEVRGNEEASRELQNAADEAGISFENAFLGSLEQAIVQ